MVRERSQTARGMIGGTANGSRGDLYTDAAFARELRVSAWNRGGVAANGTFTVYGSWWKDYLYDTNLIAYENPPYYFPVQIGETAAGGIANRGTTIAVPTGIVVAGGVVGTNPPVLANRYASTKLAFINGGGLSLQRCPVRTQYNANAPWAVEGWVLYIAPNTYLYTENTNSTTDYVQITITGTGQLFYNDLAGGTFTFPNASFLFNGWNHWLVWWDGATLWGWINNVLAGSVARAKPAALGTTAIGVFNGANNAPLVGSANYFMQCAVYASPINPAIWRQRHYEDILIDTMEQQLYTVNLAPFASATYNQTQESSTPFADTVHCVFQNAAFYYEITGIY